MSNICVYFCRFAIYKATGRRSHTENVDSVILLEKSPNFLGLADEGTPCLRRILILLMQINAVSWSVQSCCFLQEYIEGLHLYFEMVPDPYPSLEEIKRLLTGYLGHVNKSELLVPVYKELVRLFPGSSKSYEPRSMSHLARCQVRQTLRKRGPLPIVVKNLVLPKRIKNYILCK